MKKASLFVINILLFIATAFAQPCLPGGHNFYTQNQIDNFQIDHPNCTEIEGPVHIEGPDISNLDGLNVVTYMGNLEIYSNDTLMSLSGLENLNTVGGDLIIGGILISAITCSIGNPYLHTIEGLSGVTSIGGSLEIIDNDSLGSLTGLDNINAASISNLRITENQLLSSCEVESICAYLTDPNGYNWIYDNAAGCNSPEEVLDSCEANAVSINELSLHDRIKIFPNPAKTELNISAEECTIDEVNIFSISGQRIVQIRPVNATIDISELKAGMYVVEVIVENTRIRKKLLVE